MTEEKEKLMDPEMNGLGISLDEFKVACILAAVNVAYAMGWAAYESLYRWYRP